MPSATDNRLLASSKRTDEVHGQRVADLERTIAELHAALLDLATSTLQLLDINPPRKPADAVIMGEIVKRARKVLAHLEPPSR